MIAFAFVDDDGIPTGGGMRPVLPAGAVVLDAPFAPVDLRRLMFQGGEWSERPALPGAEPTKGGFRIAGLPRGAMVLIADRGTGRRTDLPSNDQDGIAGDLPEDGAFEITVTAPLPWLPSSVTITRGKGSAELAAASLARARKAAGVRINAAIGQVRLRYVTDIPGQQAIYTEKLAEARAWLALRDEPATLADFPLLAAEVGVTAPTPWHLAQIWANKSALWRQVAGQTERLRMEAAAAIDAAPDEAAVDAAVDVAVNAALGETLNEVRQS